MPKPCRAEGPHHHRRQGRIHCQACYDGDVLMIEVHGARMSEVDGTIRLDIMTQFCAMALSTIMTKYGFSPIDGKPLKTEDTIEDIFSDVLGWMFETPITIRISKI